MEGWVEEMAKIGWDRGGRSNWPVRVFDKLKGQSVETSDFAYRALPAGYYDHFYDFSGALETYELTVQLTTDGGVHEQATTGNNTGYVRVPRAGRLVSAQLTAEDALATSDTNFLTFTVTNTLGSGSGTTAMLAATDANTTKATGGTAITAVVGRSLTVHATAANLRVAAGDVLQVTEAVTGTLANAVDKPTVILTFATVPAGLVPRISRIAGSPLVAPTANAGGGALVLQLEATNEAQIAGVDWGDQLTIDPTKPCLVQFRAQLSGVAANVRFVLGLASAFNATFDSVVSNAWFRIEGNSLALLTEADDGTTDSNDQGHGRTLVAATDYTFTVDLTRGTSHIRFFLDNDGGSGVGSELAAPLLSASTLLQPVVYVQKASGTTTNSLTLKHVRVIGQRY